MKRYITKIGNRSRARKFATEKAKRELKESIAINKDVLRFIRQPINNRSYNIMDLMLRTEKVYRYVETELSRSQINLLIYLYNIESASTKKISEDMSMPRLSASKLIYILNRKDLLVSKRVGNANYVYITEEGKRSVKTFVDIVTKQEFNILSK